MTNLRQVPGRILGALVDRGISRKIKRKAAAREREREEWLHHWNTRAPRPLPDVMNQVWLDDGITVDSQPESRFFQLLPLELRQAIYEFALGSETIELELRDDPKDACFTLRGKAPKWLLALPSTCRLACVYSSLVRNWNSTSRLITRRYKETVNTVYKHNTFSAASIPPILLIQSFIVPRLLNTISSLNLVYSIGDLYIPVGPPRLPPDNEASWEEMWFIISGMQGLKRLRVKLLGCKIMHDEVEKGLLGPMERCKVDQFFVSVTWEVTKGTEEREWPFSIQRPGDQMALEME